GGGGGRGGGGGGRRGGGGGGGGGVGGGGGGGGRGGAGGGTGGGGEWGGGRERGWRPPVVSPTATIWHTIGGKILLSASGSATVFPWLMLTRLSIIAFSTTLLPAVLAVIASPSKIGTPELRRIAMF